MTDYRNAGQPKLIADLNINDRYNDIGQPVMKTLPNGVNVIRQNGDDIFFSGAGSTPDGDRPFFRRMNLNTLKTEEIFRSGIEEYETFAAYDRRQRNEIPYAKRIRRCTVQPLHTAGLPSRTNLHGDCGQSK